MYTCTLQDYQNLCAAYNTGALSIQYADKTVTYPSREEMERVMKKMERYLFPNQIAPKNRLVVASKGVYNDRFVYRNQRISRIVEFDNDPTDYEYNG